VRAHAQRAGRLAAHDDRLVAVGGQLAALEAQAGVPAREALRVDEVADAPFLVADEQQRDLLEVVRAPRELAQDAERQDVTALHVDAARADEQARVALQRAVDLVRVDSVDVAEQQHAAAAAAAQGQDQVVGVVVRRAGGALDLRLGGRQRPRDRERLLRARDVTRRRGDRHQAIELLLGPSGDPLGALCDARLHSPVLPESAG